MGDYKIVNSGKLDADLLLVANAIRGKTGGKDALLFPDDFAAAVEGLDLCGGQTVREKDVNFYDYDGSLLYAYTLEEVQAMTVLPPAPVPPKDYLLFDEWNWTLSQLQALALPVNVGAVYKTIDQRSYAVVALEYAQDLHVVMRVKVWYSNLSVPVLQVDWGDGNQEEFASETTGTISLTVEHTYKAKGQYTIAITGGGLVDLGHASADTTFLGGSGYDTILTELYMGRARLTLYSLARHTRLKHLTMNKEASLAHSNSLQRCSSNVAMILPSTATVLNSYCCDNNSGLQVLSLPYGITTVGEGAVSGSMLTRITFPPKAVISDIANNKGLREIFIAEGATQSGWGFLNGDYSLASVNLPQSMTSISSYAFANCCTLLELVIPEAVTTIGSNAFSGMCSMKRLRFLSQTPPVVADANAFSELPANCIVEVPAGTLETYQNTTNYGTIADQMVEVSA